jgi:hypothetical protein
VPRTLGLAAPNVDDQARFVSDELVPSLQDGLADKLGLTDCGG